MSVGAGSRSIAYSADTAGRSGKITCQVIRSEFADAGRVRYAIVVRNDTGSEAQALAFVPDALDARYRTLVQAGVGAYSDFSTNVEIELARYGGKPELHIGVSGDDIDFALIVPNARALGDDTRTAKGPIALANSEGLRSCALPGTPRNSTVVRAQPRRERNRGELAAPRLSSVRSDGRDERTARSVRKSPAAIPMILFFAATLVAVAVAVLRPQVSALVVPPRALSATTIPIAYRATGLGAVTYRVLGPDGTPVAGGPLATGSGTFTIVLAKDRENRAYIVRVSISGPFGGALAEDYVRIPAALTRPRVVSARPLRAVAPPQIRSLAVDRAALSGGDTLNVYYDVAAASGNVALIDAGSQIAYGKSELSPSGHTGFVVPVVQTERSFSVVLTAQRGAAITQSRIAVTAAPQSSSTPQPDGDAGNSSPSGVAVSSPMIIAPKTVGSGQPLRVDVKGGISGLVLTVNDKDGSELARRELGTIQSSTIFTAPLVSTPTRIRLQATYPQGSGSETIVQTIVVVPR